MVSKSTLRPPFGEMEFSASDREGTLWIFDLHSRLLHAFEKHSEIELERLGHFLVVKVSRQVDDDIETVSATLKRMAPT